MLEQRVRGKYAAQKRFYTELKSRLHADHIAAINIATRSVERWGEVMRPHAAPTLTAS
ncbi:hypothetical protein [Candidatus Mycobacterium methanotrophicum]|uniref:Transposase n=1 Tax=Candidatus Mycobacterium methanotrophicum TaxID=2943498 RepID=A0ABY4QIY8_9MYCO|nr:hypothetical protein [Candidatus Mycobacterium methanotrophicum]UQX09768.1 hypothetical protein M5I08_15845 [Candidatus Mycobacterium methanotrophicum]